VDNQETIKRLRESRHFMAADLLELSQDVEATYQRLMATFVRTVLTSHFDDADQDNNAHAVLTNLLGLAEQTAYGQNRWDAKFKDFLHHRQFMVAGEVLREVALETIKGNADNRSAGQLAWPPRVQKLVMDKLLYHLRIAEDSQEFLMQWEALCYILQLGLLGRSGLDKEVEKSVQEIVSGKYGTAVSLDRVHLPRLGLLTLHFPALKEAPLGKWEPDHTGHAHLVRLIMAALTHRVRTEDKEHQFFTAVWGMFS